MHVVHRGFDTIALSIQANIPQELYDYLNAERERAEELRQPVPVSYGGAEFDLQFYGGRGYRFTLTNGPLGITWYFKKPNARDPWGIRLELGSTLLATQGLGNARAQIDSTLARLGIRYGAHQVSISRADFCVDVLAPDFELIPENFVIHSHSNRADYLSVEEDIRSNGKSGRYTSVTVGKMPGRQVIIYDKRREVIDRVATKAIWWDIWNANLERDGLPPLYPNDLHGSRVWRIEIRAGKDLLKDRWGIRQWAEFDDLFGDVVAEALQKIRYCQPDPTDNNRARWGNEQIWDTVATASAGDLAEMRSYLDPGKVKYVHRGEHTRLILAQLVGTATTLAALEGVQEEGLNRHLGKLGGRLAEAARTDPEHMSKKLKDASERYRFLE